MTKSVKEMTDKELIEIWESALYAPIDAEIPEIVVEALHELVDREDAYLASLEKEYLANFEKEGDPQ